MDDYWDGPDADDYNEVFGHECSEPGDWEDCAFSEKEVKKHCAVWKECKAGTL